MKDITLPSAFISNTKQTLKYENTPVVNLSLDTICFEGETKNIKTFNVFYERLLNGFSAFAQNKFYDFAVNDFITDENPRKKYRYVPFDICFQITSQEQNNKLCINIKVSVSKRRKILAEKTISHCWSIGKRNVYLSRSHSPHPHKNKTRNNL